MGESKEYMTLPEENGSINISEEVIAAIAVGAVTAAEGTSPEHRRPEAHSLRAATRSRPDAAASGPERARMGSEKVR